MPAAYFDWEPDIDFISRDLQPDTPQDHIIDLVEAVEFDNTKIWPFLGEIATDTCFSYNAIQREVVMQVRGVANDGFPHVRVKVLNDGGITEFSGVLLGYFAPEARKVVDGVLRVGFSPVIREAGRNEMRRLPVQKTRPYLNNKWSVQRVFLG